MKKAKYPAFLLLLLALAGAFFYLQNDRRRELEKAAAAFLTSLQNGDLETAAAYLAMTDQEKETLLNAFSSASVSLASPEKISQKGKSGSVLVTADIKGKRREVELSFMHTAEGWKITSFPGIELLHNAYMEKIENSAGYLTCFFQLDGRTASYRNSLDLPLPEVNSLVEAAVMEGELIYLEELPYLKLAKILARGDDFLEDINHGRLPVETEAPFYYPFKEELELAPHGVIPGLEDIKAYRRDGNIIGLVAGKKFVPWKIRVLLNREGFTGITHTTVKATGTTAFVLTDIKEGSSFNFKAGQELTFTPGEKGVEVALPGGKTDIFSSRLELRSEEEAGKIKILSFKRGSGSSAFFPEYRGSLEIALHGDNLLLVNELPLEEYLYAVVPSEMPLRFGLEPLKAQAVAARSYALKAILRSGYGSFGAHVDDSVNSQVYNNIPEYDLSTRAVRETTGLVPFYGNNIIDARFFSTSAGYTANYHEVWEDRDTKAFPSTPVPYLCARSQLVDLELDLANEDRLRDFFDRENWHAFDSSSPYFRWETTLTREELEAAINANLAERYQDQGEFVLTLVDGNYSPREIPPDPLGKLIDLNIVSRGEGGNITALEIIGEKGSYLIKKEYNIRFLLRPVQYIQGRSPVLLHRIDGSVLENYSIMPSAFFYCQLTRDQAGDIQKVTFRGGGNGHGVGMSQWGAFGMSQLGHSFESILKHYYPKIELWSIYAW